MFSSLHVFSNMQVFNGSIVVLSPAFRKPLTNALGQSTRELLRQSLNEGAPMVQYSRQLICSHRAELGAAAAAPSSQWTHSVGAPS